MEKKEKEELLEFSFESESRARVRGTDKIVGLNTTLTLVYKIQEEQVLKFDYEHQAIAYAVKEEAKYKNKKDYEEESLF